MGKRLYMYNENYFNQIDSNNKAYWLGFIMADGYVFNQHSNNNTKSSAVGLRIRLSENDKEILEKLRSDINGNMPIRTVKNYGIYEGSNDLSEIHINSLQFYKDLTKNGISSGNKSCNESMPSLNSDILTKNFILGLFDGDGSVSSYNSWYERDKKYKELYEWSIVSSKKMCEQVKKFLEDNIDGITLSVSRNSKGSELYRVRTSSKKAIKKIYTFLYQSDCSSSYLERKYDKMYEIYNK